MTVRAKFTQIEKSFREPKWIVILPVAHTDIAVLILIAGG